MKLISACILFYDRVGQTACVYIEEVKMDLDNLKPQNKSKELKNLEVMSVDALKDYIIELEAEIARVRSSICLKKVAKEGAESFFKK
jgi:uncharacterized small protein (DUF1192 family)